jgi:hypothetical protein
MSSRSEVILEELENIATRSGNKMLERRLADLAIWFYRNNKRLAPENLLLRQAFMEKALWTMIEVQALILERMQEMELARKGPSRLYLPVGVRINGHDYG